MEGKVAKEIQVGGRIYAYLGELRLPDGRRWLGDESWGFPEGDSKLPKPESPGCGISAASNGESDT